MLRRSREIPEIKEKLMIYDHSDLTMRGKAKSFLEKSPAKHAIEPARNSGQVVRALAKYTQLKWVIFNTHGGPGYITLPEGSITSTEASFLRCNIPIFQNNARVLFSGCNVAEGQVGRDFLFHVGQNMLIGKGGCIGASDSVTWDGLLTIFAASDTTWTFWGNLRVLCFDRTGNLVQEVEV